jgi:alcohol oxidase
MGLLSYNAPGLTVSQFETYHGKGDRENHGHSGPVQVSKGTYIARRAEDTFLDAATSIGYPEVRDLQDLDSNNGVERYMRYVGPNGRRQDSAHTYLHPKLQSGKYPNLHVLVEKQVVRVLFDDNKRATGVEYQTNPKFMANPEYLATGYASPRTVRASKMVIVSAGANATPLILERSGVGDPKVLDRAGIPVIEDLPGVGADYQDHHLTLWSYRTNLTSRETINGFSDGRFDIHEAIRHNDELLGTNAMDARKYILTPSHKLHADQLNQRANSAQPKKRSPPSVPNSRKHGTATSRTAPTDRS